MRTQGKWFQKGVLARRCFLAFAMVISWTTISQTKEPRIPTLTPTVLSEARSRVARFDQIEPDCTGQAPLVVVTKPPAKGQIETEEDLGFALYSKELPQHKCNDQRTLGVSVFYTSRSGFKGDDSFEIEVFYTTYSVTRKVRFKVTVK
jgi:hypothetical protein